MIDDGLEVPINTPVKLFFNEDLKYRSDYLQIRAKIDNNKPIKVEVSTIKKTLRKIIWSDSRDTRISSDKTYLKYYYVLNGFHNINAPQYNCVYFAKGTVIEMVLTSYDDELHWITIGDPIVGRYKYRYEYSTSPSWNITAEAVVYASGLKIQWGNFTYHSTSNDEFEETYFPVRFNNTPSMSFTFDTNVGSGALDADVVHRDTPYAFDTKRWKLHSAAEGTYGYWQAIGY